MPVESSQVGITNAAWRDMLAQMVQITIIGNVAESA
jgi:hypothetical protein